MKNTIFQSKAWVYSTAFFMSLNGGYINSVCLVSLLKSPVGYVTGNLTLAGEWIEQGQFGLFINLIALVFCFLFGSMLSGLVIQGENFKIDRRYCLSLVLQFVAVLAAMVLLLFHYYQASYLLALTMGMQNAMTTHYGSALIRTTHMTGTATDLGILLGHWLKGYVIARWKIILYISLILGFTLGVILGALGYHLVQAYSLILCALFYLGMMSWAFSQGEKA